MGIIVFGYTFFFFLFFGRSLLRPFVNKQSTIDQKMRQREGIALIGFIAIIILTANLGHEIHWLAFVTGMLFGFNFNSDCETL
jgi:hypothetical protein